MGFTNYITKITEVGNTTNNTHDLVDTSASHYVKGTQTSSTNAWTGALPDGVTAYYDGLSIDYFLPYAGTSTAATLNLGSKGAKPVYYGNGTGAVTTHYPQYSVIHLTYIINSNLNSGNGCWKADAYYNTNTTYTAGTGLSLSSTTFNHSNSITAQTTQAVYPIKIDAQGHISAYGTAVTPLTSHQTIKQDGVTGATANRFGTCGTAAGTAAKTVSITTGTFALEAGSMVTVKFSNANTANSPTLNVNSSGAKNIFHRNAQITSGANKALLSGVVLFVYDGTQWHLIDGHYVTASTTSVGSASAGTAISADDITGWTTNTPTAVTKKTVVTSASGATASYSGGTLTLTNGSFSTGDSVSVTAGTAASLSYTSRSIPNISVSSTTVANGVTLS